MSTSGRGEQRRGPSIPIAPGAIGLLADGLVPQPGPVVFGAEAAVRGFTAALLRHGQASGYELYAAPSLLARARAHFETVRAGSHGPPCRVWPLHALGERVGADPPLAMHDPTGDLWRMHYVRSRLAPGSYPVTVAHHSVSYAAWRHSMFLPALMAGYRAYDAIVCSSTAARSAMEAIVAQVQCSVEAEYAVKLTFRGRLPVIPLGVDTAVFRPRGQAEARAQFGLPPDALILLSLGRFSYATKTDPAPLLLAFRQLRQAAGGSLYLVLAGSDPFGESGAVASLVADIGLRESVRLLTALPDLAVPALYAAADIFISIPDNVQEMFGQTPVEAMASGLPVVVSDWDGHRDTVADGEVGFRIPTVWAPPEHELTRLSPLLPHEEDHLIMAQAVAVDIRRLFECLRQLIAEPDLRRRLGERGRARAQMLDWEKVVRLHEELWLELAEVSRRSAAEGPECGLPRAPSAPAPGREAPLGYLEPGPAGAFGHFATRLLSAEMRVCITDLGVRTVKGRERLRVHEPFRAYLDADALHRALAALRVARRLRSPLSVGAIVAYLGRRSQLQEGEALRHVAWLLKYGLISLADGA